jgi:hypothetical protein
MGAPAKPRLNFGVIYPSGIILTEAPSIVETTKTKQRSVGHPPVGGGVALGLTSATIVGLPAAPFSAAEGCLAGGVVIAVTSIPLVYLGAALTLA